MFQPKKFGTEQNILGSVEGHGIGKFSFRAS